MGILDKIKNKTFLDALIILLGCVVVLFMAISTFFSYQNSDCNTEISNSLINQTNQFIQKQSILIERTWAIDRRNVMEAVGNTEEAKSAQDGIPLLYREYTAFLDQMEEKENRISQMIEDCKTKGKLASFFLILAFITIIIQIIVSRLYLKKY